MRPDYSRRRSNDNYNNSTQYRYNVKISDGKNEKNDVNFCTNLSFDSEKVAKGEWSVVVV